MLGFDGWIGGRRRRPGNSSSASAWPVRDRAAHPDPAHGKLDILRQPIGQRILRYASLDDIAIWGVLALILMDWERIGRQGTFLVAFAVAAWVVPPPDGPPGGARPLVRPDLAGRRLRRRLGRPALHGRRFLAGRAWRPSGSTRKMDLLRHHVLLVIMPVFFPSTGLRTNWDVGGAAVRRRRLLLVMSVSGKLLGVRLAGRILKWGRAKPASSAGCCRPRR